MSDQKDLARKVQEDLASRSLQGTWGQPCALLMLFLTTDCAPALVWGASAVMVIQSSLRLILLRRMHLMYPGNPGRWEFLHMALVMFCAAFWGALAAFAIWAYGYHNQNTLVFLLCHAGIALGMVTLLVHNLRLMHIALALLYAAQIASQLLFGADGRWGPTMTIVAYLIYLAVQGKKLHQAYWRQIKDNHELATVARHDYLTRLPNRLFMEEVLETSIAAARRTGGQVALLYIDLDGFKQINDRFSHRIGDLFLCEIAGRLTAGIQTQGIAARLGGDEFTILVNECPSTKVAFEIAERVLRLAREPLSIEGHSLCFSASVGVSLFPSDADVADQLVRAADQAMYAAKTSGKNRVCFFETIGDRARMVEAPEACYAV
jgi:diguanylate cyclase (GGDEF)-like protein